MKIQLNNLSQFKNTNHIAKTKIDKLTLKVPEVLNEINSVRLNFERNAEKLTAKEYLMARSYLANAEMEQLYKAIEKDL